MLSKEEWICQNFQQSLLEKTKIVNSVKIISGSLKGRVVKFDSTDSLRPTLGRIRETLFNWLFDHTHSANCLDLFAGSGSLGFEAISRGASHCTFVELSKKNVDNIQQNINTFGLKNCDVIHQDAHQFISNSTNKFDLIFFDPPFASSCYLWLDDVAKKILAPQGIIYLESSKTVESNVLKAIKHKKTKSLYYGIYEQDR